MIFQIRGEFCSNAGSAWRNLVFFLSLLCILPFSQTASAQSAAVTGLVMDPTGAVVPKARVTLTNIQTNTAQRAMTNADGLYSLPFVQPGKYTLTVEAPGFARYEQTNITVETAQNLALHVRLKVGDTSQSVTVDGSGAQINTTDASVSTVVDRQFVENIPLNGRSFQSLITIVPGVTVVPTNSNDQGGEFSVNGQRTESNYFTVDGVSANTGTNPGTPGYSAGYGGSIAGETVLGTTQSLISIDALQEFRATTSTYSAEYGRSPGGQFTFSSRSGTNEWHGSAFDYLRNDALDANNWFNNNLGEPRQMERQNDFGGTLGGPILFPRLYDGLNRTFFFFSYEGLRLRQPQAAQQYEVPSLTLRQTAPAALQSSLSSFPLPNGGDAGDGLSYFTSGYVSPSSLDTIGLRIDHNVSDRFKVFGRYNHSTSANTTRNSSDLSNPQTASGAINSLTLGTTNVLSSHTSNDARFNWTLNDTRRISSLDNFGGATPMTLADVPGLTSSDWLLFFLAYGTYPYYSFTPQTSKQTQWNVTDTANLAVGHHNFRMGIDFRRLTTEGSLPGYYEVPQFYSGTDVLQNNATTFFYQDQGEMTPVYTNFSAFAQDEWKLTKRLSLSLGVRWDVNPAPHDAHGNDPYGVTSTDIATVALAPRGTPLWHTTYGNFAPRFGVAYQVHETPGYETVVRAGAGMFYDTGNITATEGYFFGIGITSSSEFDGQPFPLTSAQVNSVPPPSAAPPYAGQVIGFDPNLKLPHTWEWNVAIEQGLGRNQNLTMSYVGSAGRGLLLQKEYDPTLVGNPNFVSTADNGGGLFLTTNGASSDYNALQVQFQRKMARGLQALISYTWSHAFDDVTSNFQIYTQERAASDYDIRNNFQAAITYNLPSNHNQRLSSAILEDWAIDGRVSARSALPVDVFGTTYVFSSIGTNQSFHPNRVPNVPLYLYDPGLPGGRAINYQAFSIATDSNNNPVEGNFPRNGARGFNAVQADVAVRRDFPLKDQFGLQFRAEAFNVFNHPIFGTIYNSLSDGPALFGMAYQTLNSSLGGLSPLYQVGGPRSLQVALRLHF